jgi:dihydropteroate synthase
VSLERARALGELARSRGADLVLMHSRGDMSSMPGGSTSRPSAPRSDRTRYVDVVADVAREWLAAAEEALSTGLPRDALWFDPGIGFHKDAEHSLELLVRLAEFEASFAPRFGEDGPRVVVGASRKSFIAARSSVPGELPGDRLGGSIATALSAAIRGARMLRVHDVQATRQALDLFFAVEDSRAPSAHASRTETGRPDTSRSATPFAENAGSALRSQRGSP